MPLKILLLSTIILTLFSCSEPEEVVKIIEQPIAKSKISPLVKARLYKKLNTYFTDQNKYHGFNGSVLIAKNNEVVFKGYYGKADFSSKTLLDSSYSFQLASLSKQFTAAAIVILQQKGKLQFDDTITKYFPDFHYNKATIRQCLNHTAGLPKYFWVAEHKWDNDYAPTNMQMMEMFEDDDVLPYFSPGHKYAYSNTAYFVLASIIEKVSGMSYAEFLKKYIFEPLQMNNSYAYSYSYDKVVDKQLFGYRRSGRRFIKVPGTINDAIVGDKNVYSNIDDLFKWYIALNNNSIIADSNLIQMYTEGTTFKGYSIPYGFGFHIDKENNIIYHNGKWNGFRNSFRQYRDDKVLIIVLEHSSYRGFSAFVNNVKAIVDTYNFD